MTSYIFTHNPYSTIMQDITNIAAFVFSFFRYFKVNPGHDVTPSPTYRHHLYLNNLSIAL